ncbi:MAG: transporter [Gemmatimonadales bacterium]
MISVLSGLLVLMPVQRDEPIRDNSFLIEEAYNQDAGVVQHVSTFSGSGDGEWELVFGQEWPLGGQRYQVGLSLPVLRRALDGGARTGIGDPSLGFRWQVAGIDGGPVAVAPRVSILLPLGDDRTGHGSGGLGLQLSLPISYQPLRRWVFHGNAGMTLVPGTGGSSGTAGPVAGLGLGGSAVWLLASPVNLLLEGLWTLDQAGRGPVEHRLILSPGLRAAVNLAGGVQVVPGMAYMAGLSGASDSFFLYLSVEHPFRPARP